LKKTKILLNTPRIPSGQYTDYKFPLTGNAKTFLDFIVSNLNRTGSGYVSGTYKETGLKTIQFNNWNAFEAINEISTSLGFSWYIVGKTLHFNEKPIGAYYTFQVGRKAGFPELIRTRVESEQIETVVYGYGSTQNLPPRTASFGLTYDGNLLTENRLCFSGVNGESKLEKNVDLYGRIESIQEFDDIKPEFVGTVSSISSDLNVFFDTGIDFDINLQLLSGISPKINFLSGKLLGINFGFVFDYPTKRYTLSPYTDESGIYPNELIHPEIGDTYTLIDILMPESYITSAKLRLQEAVQIYIDKQSKDLEVYEGQPDEEFISSNDIILNLGDFIRVVSIPFILDNTYEIKELVQNIIRPSLYSLKFGDVLPKSFVNALKNANFATKQQIYNIERNTYTTTEVTNQVTNITGQDLEWQSL
jgi:hypothetical protein